MKDKLKCDSVYLVFEERQLSCDRDYGDDGFIIIWDSEEIGRNLTTCELIEKVGKLDNEIYRAVINYILKELSLNYGISSKELNDYFFEEVFEFIEDYIGKGIFYLYYYQNNLTVKEVCKTEEYAKSQVKYYNENISYNNKYSYEKYILRY